MYMNVFPREAVRRLPVPATTGPILLKRPTDGRARRDNAGECAKAPPLLERKVGRRALGRPWKCSKRPRSDEHAEMPLPSGQRVNANGQFLTLDEFPATPIPLMLAAWEKKKKA